MENSFEFWTNGIVRRSYRPTLLLQKSRKPSYNVSIQGKPLMRICQKRKKFKCKANKMQQWLILQHVGSLQWLLRFHAFNSIKRLQVSFAIIFLFFIIFDIIWKYICDNFLQCWWEWILNGVQQHINTCWNNWGLKEGIHKFWMNVHTKVHN
jgi:hypothetical protein